MRLGADLRFCMEGLVCAAAAAAALAVAAGSLPRAFGPADCALAVAGAGLFWAERACASRPAFELVALLASGLNLVEFAQDRHWLRPVYALALGTAAWAPRL